MHFSSSLCGTFALAAAAAVSSTPIAARATHAVNEYFQVTNLVIADSTAGNTSITFNAFDPNPLANITATCTATWQHNTTNYPSSVYKLCGNTTFAWRLDNVVNLRNFTLSLDHSFEDPSVGAPPWDHVTNFGRAAINQTLLECEVFGASSNCVQKPDVIYADIYGTIAK